MPFLFEPKSEGKRGSHRALEVDPERLGALTKALDLARTYGKAAPIVSLINEHASVTLDVATFFRADDGYPSCGNLGHYIPEVLRAEGAAEFGLDNYGPIFNFDLLIGDPLMNLESPEAPEWIDAAPKLDFVVALASRLLDDIDFAAGVDDDAIAEASELLDRGELGDDISSVGEFQVDALDDWAAELHFRLDDLRFTLESIADRDGIVLSWYE